MHIAKGRRRAHAGASARAIAREHSHATLASARHDARASAGARARSLVPVWRDCLLDTDTPVDGVRQAARRSVRVPARVGAGRRRDVGALHVPGQRAARGVAAARRRRRGLDAATRLARRAATGGSARRSRRARSARARRSRCRELGSSGAARSAIFGYDVVRLIERLPTPPARGVHVPDALFVFTDALVIIDNLRSQARVVVGAQRGRRHERRDAARRATIARCADVERTIAKLRAPATLPPLDLRTDAPPAEGVSTRRASGTSPASSGSASTSSRATRSRCSSARRIDVPHDFPSDGALSRAARAQSVAVHVPPRARRRGARRQLAGAARARERRDA